MASNESLLRGIPMDNEPKRPNRFFLEFPADLGIESWSVQKFKRPKMTINPVEIKYMNMSNWVAGQFKWEAMQITLLDCIGPSSSQKVMEWVRLHAETLTGRMGYAAGYKKTLTLRSLDPVGVPIEKWTLIDCMITDVDFGDNDHESDAIQQVTFTVQPYQCILNV